jgi:hypothetical protein
LANRSSQSIGTVKIALPADYVVTKIGITNRADFVALATVSNWNVEFSVGFDHWKILAALKSE